MVLTGLEWGGIALLTTLTGLLSAYIVYRVIRINLKRTINGFIPVVGNVIRAEMGKTITEATENLDLGAIAGQLGGGEGDLGGLGDIAGMLGGGEGGLGQLLKLFSTFSGQRTKKGGHNPGK